MKIWNIMPIHLISAFADVIQCNFFAMHKYYKTKVTVTITTGIFSNISPEIYLHQYANANAKQPGNESMFDIDFTYDMRGKQIFISSEKNCD